MTSISGMEAAEFAVYSSTSMVSQSPQKRAGSKSSLYTIRSSSMYIIRSSLRQPGGRITRGGGTKTRHSDYVCTKKVLLNALYESTGMSLAEMVE